MKRKITAAALCVLMLLGLFPSAAWAARTEDTGEAALMGMAAPTDARWITEAGEYDGEKAFPGFMAWTDADNPEGTLYTVEVFNASGEVAFSTEAPKHSSSSTVLSDAFPIEWEAQSGTYYFTVQAVDSSDATLTSDIVSSDRWTYTKPSASLAVPANIALENAELSWSSVENAAGYEYAIAYTQAESLSDYWDNSKMTVIGWEAITSETVEGFLDQGAGYYHYRVRALSGDITQYSNSGWSDIVTGYYDGSSLTSKGTTSASDGGGSSSGGGTSSDSDALSGYCGAEGNEQNVTWKLENGTLTISGTGKMADYIQYVNGVLNTPWYSYRESITSAVIESGVENIGAYEFSSCTSLTSVTIPNSVTSIGTGAFEDCTRLTSVTIPDSVTSIGNSLFMYCTNLTSVTIPDSITSIGSSLFEYCTNLTSVTIPDSVTVINNRMFFHCTSLTSVTIPDSVTSIGSQAFDSCTSLTSVTIPDSVTSIEEAAFENCTNLLNVTIPNSVTSIEGSVFYSCTSLTSVEIPNSVTYIGTSAFNSCTSLTSVTIPVSVTSIDKNAFANCTSLTNVTIPNSVKTIGEYAFYNCSDLADVYYGGTEAQWSAFASSGIGNTHNGNDPLLNATIHCTDGVIDSGSSDSEVVASGTCGASGNEQNVTWTLTSDGTLTISGTGRMADYGENSAPPWQSHASSIKTAVIGDGVTNVGSDSFFNVTTLTAVSFGNAVQTIGQYAFNGSGLTAVTIPNTVTSIGDYAFSFCDSLTAVTIPASVTSLGEAPFGGCKGLTAINVDSGNSSFTSENGVLFSADKSLLIQYPAGRQATSYTAPDGVLSIGGYAFKLCSNLTSVTLPDGVEAVDWYGFWDCTGLAEITLPASLQSVEKNAFLDCSALSKVNYTGTEEQWTALKSSGIDNTDNGNDPLLKAEINYTQSSDALSGYCGAEGNEQNVMWRLENGVLTISGTGKMADFTTGENPWFDHGSEIQKIVVESGVTSLGYCAFNACVNTTDISLPDTLQSIGYMAFRICHELTRLTLPSGVMEISEDPCFDCPKLAEILVDSRNTSYTSVDGVLFTSDGKTLVEYPSAKSGTSFTVPSDVEVIGKGAFDYCGNLAAVTIPVSVKSIGEYAFIDCTALTDVYYGGTQAQWSALASSGIGNDNDPLLKATIHYAQNTPAVTVTITTETVPEAVQYIPFAVPMEYTLSGESSSDLVWQVSSGALPAGVELDSSGVLSGAPTQAGTFPFTVSAYLSDSSSSGEQPASRSYTLTVKPVSTVDWETVISDGYEILDRIPDMDQFEDQTFRVAGPLSEFSGLWLDGVPLTAETNFTTSEGSTRISIPAATFQSAGDGTHTIAAAFTDSSSALRVSGQNYTVDRTGGVKFDKTIFDTAVQYVPYSILLDAHPRYNDLRFEITDRGNLPEDTEEERGDWKIDPVSGEITGVPQVAGVQYTFTVGVRRGEGGNVVSSEQITISVMDNTSTNVAKETDLGFQVLNPIPNMAAVVNDEIFRSQGEFNLFQEFYLNGVKLVRDTEYTAEEGSTRITVFAQVLRALGTGEHTAAATFVVHKKDGTNETKVSSQNFNIGTQTVSGGGGGGGGSRSSSYAITLKQATGGNVKASTLSAQSGAKVTLTLTPNAGYEVKSVSVTGTNVAGDVSVSRSGNQYTFTMPGKQVTVTPTFTRSALNVAAVTVEHGKLSVNKAKAVPGASVTITAHPDNGYVVAAFSAWDKDGKYLTVKDNGDGTALFTMPESPVQVGARFDLDPGLPVTDIVSVDWFYEDARWAYRRGILRGVTGTSWVPEDRMSSATAVVTLARLAGTDLTEYQDENWSFREDADSYGWIPSDWYAAEARWAASNNILTEDLFTGRETMPRANLAVMLRRFLTQQGVVVELPEERTVFSDAEAVEAFGTEAEEAFQVLYQAGVFRGDSSRAMLPGAYTKRSHLAATLHRLSDYIIGYWESQQSGEQENT